MYVYPSILAHLPQPLCIKPNFRGSAFKLCDPAIVPDVNALRQPRKRRVIKRWVRASLRDRIALVSNESCDYLSRISRNAICNGAARRGSLPSRASEANERTGHFP